MNLNTRLIASVPRWSVIHTIRNQTVAEHVTLVGLLAVDLYNHVRLVSAPLGDVLAGILCHDNRELVTGDVPSAVNSYIKGTSPCWQSDIRDIAAMLGIPDVESTDPVRKIVRYLDLLESVQFLWQEELMGNRTVGSCKDYLAHLTLNAEDLVMELESDATESDITANKIREWGSIQRSSNTFSIITDVAKRATVTRTIS